MAKKVDYKSVFLTSLITGITVAIINRVFASGQAKGLSAALHVFANLPTLDQARFADAETIENAGNPKWLIEQFSNINPEDPEIYNSINRTSIANCAFISLYGAHPESREKCQQILNNLKNPQL
ncbi:MAG: hypothetical protein AAF634_13165 [Bacteroidota bacterium]